MEIFMPDHVIVKEGDIGTSMFILSAGKATATVKTNQVAEYESGAIFGELTLLGIASRRTATVTAGTVCIVEVLHQHAFETILEQFPTEKRHFEQLARSHLGHCCDFSIYSWPFFRDCPSRFLYLLDINLERCVYFAGEKIVEVPDQDSYDPSSCALSMYVLLRGHAVLSKNGQTVLELNDGDVYGEMAVLGVPNEPSKILTAQSMCDMHVLTKQVVDQAFDEFPDEVLRFQDRIAQYITDNEKTVHGTGGRALRRTSLFRDNSIDFLQHLWGKLETRLFMPGVTIVEEGQKSYPCMYILRRGTAAVYVKGTKVKEYHSGECFGEIGILGFSSQRTATITPITPVVVQILHREDFVNSLGEYPENSPCFDHLRQLAEGHLDSYLRRTVAQLPVFANSDPKFLDEICEGLEERTFGPGDVVVSEHKPMTHQVMLLVSGKLVVTSGGVLTGELTPGELAIFGEISTLGVGRWTPATVHCSNDASCMVVVLHRVLLEKALTDHPEEKKKFQEIDQQRLQRDSSKLRDHLSWVDATSKDLKEKVTFFQHCSLALLFELVKNLKECVHPPNSILAEDRSSSDTLVVLLDGTADVFVDDVRLGKLGPGAVFGEENVLGFPRRTASLKARTACRTLVVPSGTLWDVLSDKAFGEDQKFFATLREHRAICALSLQKLPLFTRCDPLCLQQVALHATHVGIQRGQVWEPGRDVKHQGEAFAVFVEGSASLELEGIEVAQLGPGSAFAEGLVYKHGGIVLANERSSLYSFRRHDLLAAVLHFPKAQGWFDHFRKEQNTEFDGLKHLLMSRKARAEAMRPHPRDGEIRQYAYKHAFRHRNRRGKSDSRKSLH
jgi:CRP-like cAMP-binding protein